MNNDNNWKFSYSGTKLSGWPATPMTSRDSNVGLRQTILQLGQTKKQLEEEKLILLTAI